MAIEAVLFCNVRKNCLKKAFGQLLVLGDGNGWNPQNGGLGVWKWQLRRSETVVQIVWTTCSDNPFPPIGIIRMSRKYYLKGWKALFGWPKDTTSLYRWGGGVYNSHTINGLTSLYKNRVFADWFWFADYGSSIVRRFVKDYYSWPIYFPTQEL